MVGELNLYWTEKDTKGLPVFLFASTWRIDQPVGFVATH